MSGVRLEDLRYDDLGMPFIWFQGLGSVAEEKNRIHYPTQTLTHVAFYLTYNSILEYENSSYLGAGGSASLMALCQWFIALESYINTLLKCLCVAEGLCFKKVQKADLVARMNFIGGRSKQEYVSCLKKTGIVAAVREFVEVRNDLFHDRLLHENRVIKHTLFSSKPYYCNQVDAMQAAKIAVSIFRLFSRALPGISLVPQVGVAKNGVVYFHPVDVAYENILRPAFGGVLAKHNQGSDFNSEIVCDPLSHLNVAAQLRCSVVIKANPNVDVSGFYSSAVTRRVPEVMDRFVGRIQETQDGKFPVPKYML